jgi:hypothetical protein
VKFVSQIPQYVITPSFDNKPYFKKEDAVQTAIRVGKCFKNSLPRYHCITSFNNNIRRYLGPDL